MTTKQTVDKLWREFREAINKTYGVGTGGYANADTPEACLRDYAENISWHDRLAALLGRESANERQHRSGRPTVPGFSIETAAKLILMSQASQGAKLETMPSATLFLWARQSAAEAQVIGFICRENLSPDWHMAVECLDYAKLMQSE